jgi:hypothetical protein
MRTIGYRSNVLFIVAAAFGLLAALGRPWYGAGPVAHVAEPANAGTVKLPAEGFLSQLWREISSADGLKGWDAFTTTDAIFVGLLAVAVLSALAALLPGTERVAREVLRLVTLAMLGIVVVKLVNTPDEAGLAERRLDRARRDRHHGLVRVDALRGTARAPQAGPEPHRAASDRGAAAVTRVRLTRVVRAARRLLAASSGLRPRRAAGPGSQAGSR